MPTHITAIHRQITCLWLKLHGNTQQHTATNCNTQQHTATHGKHTATHGNTQQKQNTTTTTQPYSKLTLACCLKFRCDALSRAAAHCNTLQHSILQHLRCRAVSNCGVPLPPAPFYLRRLSLVLLLCM